MTWDTRQDRPSPTAATQQATRKVADDQSCGETYGCDERAATFMRSAEHS
jgi:hypothetical protein